MAPRTSPPRASRVRAIAPPGIHRLEPDDAFIALFIAAMEANGNVSAVEGVRAHHLIWSMNRFRDQSADHVGHHIERMRVLVGLHGANVVLDAAARAIPSRLRTSAFALAADLLLADGKVDRSERRFLERLRTGLCLDEAEAQRITEVVLVKNKA